MKEEEKHSVSEELLFRHFAGDSTAEEQQLIATWLEMSADNSLEYERMHIFYLDVKALSSLKHKVHQYNVEDAWSKVKHQQKRLKIDQVEAITSDTSYNSYGWLRIAASIVFIFGFGWVVYDNYLKNDSETLATLEQTAKQQLSDGSSIALNKNSQLTYPEEFEGDIRKVELKGEAYFEVAHNPEQPFVIKTDDINIQVLGTSFNVQAYEQVDSVVVTVDKGRVLITAESGQEILESGSVGVYYKSTNKLVKTEVEITNTYAFWRTKKVTFEGQKLSEVVKVLNQVYEVNIQLSNPELGNCRISVSFVNEKIKSILEVIATTLNLTLTEQDNQFILNGMVCAN